MKGARRLSGFLALNRNAALLLGAIVLIGAGEEMWMRFLPKYMETLGASAILIGLFDAIKTLLGAVYAFPGGMAVDRWGHRRAFVTFSLISILGYGVVLATSTAAGVLFAMFFFLAWSDLSLPAMFSLVGRTLPARKHAMGIGVQSLIRRLPVLIGPILGGILIQRLGFIHGIHAGVMASVVLAGLAVFLQNSIRAADTSSTKPRLNLFRLVAQFDPDLKRLLFSDVLIRFSERIPYAWVVIYAMDYLGASPSQVGVLIAIEMAAAILCYVPASYLADRFGREPFVVATFIFFTLFPVSMLLANGFRLLALAFAIRGLKEFGEPARKSLIIAHAPLETSGHVIGGYYLVRDLVVTSGSFVGAALWKVSPPANFAGAALVGALGTLSYVRTLPHRDRAHGRCAGGGWR